MSEAGYIAAVEGGQVDTFGHREHVQLAFSLLRTRPPDVAAADAERILRRLAESHGDDQKFHVTLTRAWMDAVAHHMSDGAPGETFDDLLARHPQLLRSNLLEHHYSRDVLFSPAARGTYVAPDRAPIPA